MPTAGRSSPSRTLGVAWALASLLAPSAARAQGTTTIAEALFLQGQERMAAHDVEQACDLFTRSLKVERALGTLLNLAVCHEKQGKTATAWAEFAEAEAAAKRAGDTQRADLARTHLTVLEPAVPHILVEVTNPPSDVRAVLDGTELPREAWGTVIPLDPGQHRLEASADGRLPFARTIHLGGLGGIDRVEVTLPKKTTDPLWVGGWVSVGAGVAALGVAAGMGVEMASNLNRRDQLCPPGTPCASQVAFSADHTARVDQVAMFVSGGISLAALGVGAGLLVVSRRKQSAPSPVALTPVVVPTYAGLGLRGTF